MPEIVIINRTDDFHVCINNHPEIWDCGKTEELAIERFLKTAPSRNLPTDINQYEIIRPY